MTNNLELLTGAERMLAQAASVAEVQQVVDFAEAARVYAREAKLGTAAVNHATVIKLRAERQLATMVDAGQENGTIATKATAGAMGGRSSAQATPAPGVASTAPMAPHRRPATLDELGITSQRLAEARQLKRFSEEELNDLATKASERDREMSRQKLLKEARERAAAERAAKAAEVDEATDDPTEPTPIEIELGQWVELGPHRLYCGDSTDAEFIAATSGAALAFADPPYNARKASWDEDFFWEHDYLVKNADIVAVTPGISAIPEFFSLTSMPYRWSMAAWITNGMTRGALGFGNWIYVALFAETVSVFRNAQDHMRITVNAATTSETTHASRKPAQLMVDLLELFTSRGDLVIDPFLGSGTTLLAADKTGRRCVGAELDLDHCKEIITRYRLEMALR